MSHGVITAQRGDELRVCGEVRQAYQSSPNAGVEVTGIGGPVEVETTGGVLRLSGIEGYARAARTRAAEMRSPEKGLTPTVVRPG